MLSGSREVAYAHEVPRTPRPQARLRPHAGAAPNAPWLLGFRAFCCSRFYSVDVPFYGLIGVQREIFIGGFFSWQ